MSYTFGGATTDDITTDESAGLNIPADNQALLVAGWWYPTTLTAGRSYWGCGTASLRAEVHSTTSEIKVFMDRVTDGEWTTSGAGIVVDKWQFLAFLVQFENTGPVDNWRIWVGDLHTAPVEQTPSVVVAPVGTISGSSRGKTLGNASGAGSVAIQGDVGWGIFLAAGIGTALHSMFPIATSGTLTAAEVAVITERLVLPLWRGKSVVDYLKGNNGYTSWFMNLTQNPARTMLSEYVVTQGPNLTAVPTTIGGATFNHNQPPIRYNYFPNITRPPVPRSM